MKPVLPTALLALALPHLAIAQDRSGGPEAEPEAEAAAGTEAGGCDLNQRFYIRRDIVATQLLQCADTEKPATLSFQRDGVKDAWQASANVSLAYALTQPGTTGAFDSLFADSKLLLFGQIAGSHASDGTTTGFARAGLNYEAMLQSAAGTLDYSLLELTPYFQTDLEGDASGYGLDLSYTPVYAPANVNAVFQMPGQRTVFYTTAVLRLDSFYSNDPGTTALKAGDGYAWIGGDFGAGLQIRNWKGKKTAVFTLGLAAYSDLASGEDAVLRQANIELPLNDTGSASLNVGYSNGRPYQTLVKADQLEVAFGFKF